MKKISTYFSSSNLSPLNIYSARIRFDEWIPSGDSDFTHDFQIWDSGKKFNCDYLYVTLAFRFMMNCTNWDPMQNTSFFIRQTNGISGDYSFPVAIAVAGPVEEDKSDGSHYYNVNVRYQGLIYVDQSQDTFGINFEIQRYRVQDIKSIESQSVGVFLTYQEINFIN